MAVYSSPEGYEYDPSSGMYFSSSMIAEPGTGAPVQVVTWFDPNSGQYRQYTYPIKQPARTTTGLHPHTKGAAAVALTGILALLIALSAPIVSIYITLRGLITLLAEMSTNAISNISVDVVGGFIDGDYFGFSALWALLGEIVDEVRDDYWRVSLGLLVFVLGVFIFILFLANKRRRHIAGRILLLVCVCLCIVSGVLVDPVILDIQEVVGELPAPYDGAVTYLYMLTAASAACWVICALIYLLMIAKSKRLYNPPAYRY